MKHKHYKQKTPLVIRHNGTTRVMYLHETKMERAWRNTKRITRYSVYGVIATWTLVLIGAGVHQEMVSPEVLAVEKTIIQEPKQEIPEVMVRIAKCESGNKHFEKGQVLVRGNAVSRSSVDVGRWQINNAIWGKKASEKGFDIFSEQGNEDMAMFLYETYGTEPWVHTKKCWNK